jgi:putative hydrolase of the HAD superfamily
VSIEFVFWDFGGVFVPSPFHSADDYAAKFGLSSDELLALIFGRYGADADDHVWHRLERGEVSIEQAAEELTTLMARAGHEGFQLWDFFSAMLAHGRESGIDRDRVVAKVRELGAAGIPNAIITNNIAEFGDGWRGMIPVDELFEFVVDSSSEGVRKPDPEIYRRALARAGDPDPSRTVFLDDFEPNVIAARDQGMHGIVVGADPTAALSELDRLVG